jgi:hypothetical protein
MASLRDALSTTGSYAWGATKTATRMTWGAAKLAAKATAKTAIVTYNYGPSALKIAITAAPAFLAGESYKAYEHNDPSYKLLTAGAAATASIALIVNLLANSRRNTRIIRLQNRVADLEQDPNEILRLQAELDAERQGRAAEQMHADHQEMRIREALLEALEQVDHNHLD